MRLGPEGCFHLGHQQGEQNLTLTNGVDCLHLRGAPTKIAPWFLASSIGAPLKSSLLVLLSKVYLRQSQFPLALMKYHWCCGLSSAVYTLGPWGPPRYGAPLRICHGFVSSIWFKRHFWKRRMSRSENRSNWSGLCICVLRYHVRNLKLSSYWEIAVVYPVFVFVCFSSCYKLFRMDTWI